MRKSWVKLPTIFYQRALVFDNVHGFQKPYGMIAPRNLFGDVHWKSNTKSIGAKETGGEVSGHSSSA